MAEIKGVLRLNKKFDRLPDVVENEIKRAIAATGIDLKSQIKLLIQRGSRSGKSYKRRKGKGGLRHIASAPGEPPKTDRGGLVASIFSDVFTSGLEVEIGTDLKYGKYLELGTTKILPRPYLFPTFEKNKQKIKRRIATSVKKGYRKLTK